MNIKSQYTLLHSYAGHKGCTSRSYFMQLLLFFYN